MLLIWALKLATYGLLAGWFWWVLTEPREPLLVIGGMFGWVLGSDLIVWCWGRWVPVYPSGRVRGGKY